MRNTNTTRKIARTEPADSDPILAAIAAHKGAVDSFYALPDDVADGENDAAGEVEWEAFWALFSTAPTTIEGFVALLQYLSEDANSGFPGVSRIRRAIDCWSAKDDRYSSEAEWLRRLAGSIRKAW
jgi:hypothetical protein